MLKRPWFTLSRHDEGDEGTEGTTPPEGGDQAPSFKPITSQEELETRLASRLLRQKAQFKDYDALKAAAEELATLKAEKLSEAEKANARAEAAEKAAAETARKSAERIATAELKAALTGLVDNPADVIDDLNLAKFIGDDGEVDAAAVKKLQDKYAAIAAKKPPKTPGGDLDPGGRGDGKPLDFRTATPEQTKAALAAAGVSPW